MDTEFKDRLRIAIQNKGITYTELSKASGVSKSDISNYLKGRYVPKQDKCYYLAKALGVDPGWLMIGVEPTVDIDERARIVVPDSERFVKLVHYMPQDEYLMVMEAFEKANKRLEEEENAALQEES